MGCFSGCLVSSASTQKLFCGIYSAFKCSFDDFVLEKVVSPSYSSAILGPPLAFFFHLTHCWDFLVLNLCSGTIPRVWRLQPTPPSKHHNCWAWALKCLICNKRSQGSEKPLAPPSRKRSSAHWVSPASPEKGINVSNCSDVSSLCRPMLLRNPQYFMHSTHLIFNMNM